MDLSLRIPPAAPALLRRRERLTVGLACSLNWGPLRGLLSAFRRQEPEVELAIEDLDETGIAERLPGREIDIAVALHDAGVRGWRSAPLWSEPLLAYMAEGHPLTAANEVTPQAIREAHILMAGNGAGDLALQRAIVAALGGRRGSPTTRFRGTTCWPWSRWASASPWREARPWAPSIPGSAPGRWIARRRG